MQFTLAFFCVWKEIFGAEVWRIFFRPLLLSKNWPYRSSLSFFRMTVQWIRCRINHCSIHFCLIIDTHACSFAAYCAFCSINHKAKHTQTTVAQTYWPIFYPMLVNVLIFAECHTRNLQNLLIFTDITKIVVKIKYSNEFFILLVYDTEILLQIIKFNKFAIFTKLVLLMSYFYIWFKFANVKKKDIIISAFRDI